MNEYDNNACMSAFSKLCDEAEHSETVSSEECQYWVFERGYKAAMEEMIKVINAGKPEKISMPNVVATARTTSIH
jgi:hypothetical protein